MFFVFFKPQFCLFAGWYTVVLVLDVFMNLYCSVEKENNLLVLHRDSTVDCYFKDTSRNLIIKFMNYDSIRKFDYQCRALYTETFLGFAPFSYFSSTD